MVAGRATAEDEMRAMAARALAAAANDSGLDLRFAAAAGAAEGAERRSLEAVARLAQEVARLGEALNRRLDGADERGTARLDEVHREIRQLEAMVVQRMAAAEEGRRQGVDALRADMVAAVERLAERIGGVERTSQDAATHLAGRVDGLEAQLAAGESRLVDALDARVREGERRTQRLLGEMQASLRREQAGLGPRKADTPGAHPFLIAVLILAGSAAALSLGAVGYQLAAPVPWRSPVEPALALRPRLPADLPAASPAAPPARLVRIVPAPSNRTQPATGGKPAVDYPALAQAVLAGDAAAHRRVQALAEGGAPTAQVLLAKLYEAGQGGFPKDAALARQWTARAAQAGDRTAMHNLALFLINGDGGPVDAPAAARWFERAASAGVVDAQYNLGLLYEAGRGVGRNFGEAYRWFSIAANAGDGMARAKAVALEPKLTPRERAAFGRAAAAFNPGEASAAPTPLAAGAGTLAESQRLLARGGYYVGETDGVDSSAYRVALQAYVRDHPAGGAPAP